jgi:hypothetical protein
MAASGSQSRLAAIAAQLQVQQRTVHPHVAAVVAVEPLAPSHPRTAVFSGGPSEAQRQHLAEHGYVIVEDAVDPALMPALLNAGRRVAPRIRLGELRDRMLTPLDGEPVFAEYYGCHELLRYVLHFIQRPPEQLSLGEFCVFSQAADGPGVNGGWHRDATWWKERSGADSQGRAYDRTNPASYTEELERQIWEDGMWDRRSGSPRSIEARGGVGFHLALVDDDCFELVPGSHKRFRTEQEKEAMLDYNGLGAGKTYGLTKESPLPGGIRAALKAGQTMFWDGDMIHRGVYRPNTERLTLHNAWGSLAPLASDAKEQKRNVCDARFVHWCHPDCKTFLAEVEAAAVARGASMVPGVLSRAWEHYMATRTVPPQVERWNSTHPASEYPGYNPVEAVDEAINLQGP